MKKLKELGFDMKMARLDKGLSQFDVAKHCGVSCVSYQRWEAGATKEIRDEHYERLVEILA